MLDALGRQDVDCEMVRLVDYDIALASCPKRSATATRAGQPSSVIKRAVERMDALLSETDAEGVPVAYNKVAGFVVTGNEDGAHHVIA